MYRTKITGLLITVALLCVTCDESAAQRRSAPSTRQTVTGSMQLGQRWGTPGGGSGQTYSPIPGRQSSSPKWTLRPTYSNRRSPASRYGASISNRGYSAAPDRVQYSQARHHAHHSYSVAPYVHIQYQNYGSGYGYLNAYDQVRIQSGLSPRYHVNHGAVYPTIVAPPIVVPYGGLGSTATYAPIPFSTDVAPLTTAPAPSSPAALNNFTATSDATSVIGAQTMSRQLPVDELPVVNEFGDGRLIPTEDVSAVDRIRSLRYQASGDDAFRRFDYASAGALYKAAADVASHRRAPLLRSVWAHVAQKEFADAVVELKTALLMADDPTSSWISGANLYGKRANSDGALHGDELWQWLQRRPNSTDRLLLTAAFQKLQGYPGISRELLSAASTAGLDANLERLLMEVSVPPEADEAVPVNKAAVGVGIHLNGSEVVPAKHAQQADLGLPEPLSPQEEGLVPSEQNDLLPELVPNVEGLIIPRT